MGKSALIFIGSHDKYNEWNSGKMPTNKFVAKDGVSAGTKIANSYRAADGDSSGKIQGVADKIKSDEKLLAKFEKGELKWEEVKKEIDSSKLESSKKAFLGIFKNAANTATLLNDLLKYDKQIENVELVFM